MRYFSSLVNIKKNSFADNLAFVCTGRENTEVYQLNVHECICCASHHGCVAERRKNKRTLHFQMVSDKKMRPRWVLLKSDFELTNEGDYSEVLRPGVEFPQHYERRMIHYIQPVVHAICSIHCIKYQISTSYRSIYINERSFQQYLPPDIPSQQKINCWSK